VTWWLFDPERAISEIKAINDLSIHADWIDLIARPSITEGELIVQFDIAHAGLVYPLEIKYPSYFPDVPSRIVHRDGVNISIHQYGGVGELCLRHRAENWNPSVTGRSMIEDAYALISGEHPQDGSKGHVPSGHQLSLGQKFQSKELRFIQPPEAIDFGQNVQIGKSAEILLSRAIYEETHVFYVKAFSKNRGGKWKMLRPTLPGETELTVSIINVGATGINFYNSMDYIAAEINEKLPESDWSKIAGNEGLLFFIAADDKKWTLWLKGSDSDKPVPFDTISSPIGSPRLSGNIGEISEKTVAIVGCGSIGSKIAKTLARSGIRNLLLIDDDIFFAGNTVRNELDCSAIGFHKVDALRQNIERLPGKFKIEAKRMGLGKQNSSLRVNNILSDIGACDLIVDATANARAFNYLATVSARKRVPFVSCSVFAGGIGGTVFRCRPDIDPIPHYAKAQIKAWRSAQEPSWEHNDFDEDPYSFTLEETPLIASDADISIMAGYASQFALDIVGTNQRSAFPHSAYILGFSDEWIFKEPFHTIPIDLAPQGEWGETIEERDIKDLKELLTLVHPDNTGRG